MGFKAPSPSPELKYVACAVCNKDRPVAQIEMTSRGPVCDFCYEEYLWTEYGEEDDRGVAR